MLFMRTEWSRCNYARIMRVLPNGNIRFCLNDYKKTSIAELQFINPENEAPTIISGGGCKIIEYNED